MRTQTSQWKQKIIAALGVTGMLTFSTAPFAQGLPPTANPTEPQADQLIIRYRSDVPEARLAGVNAALGNVAAFRGVPLKFSRRGALGMHVFKLGGTMRASEIYALAAELRKSDPNILYAEPDLMVYPDMTPNDPEFANQWHYHNTSVGVHMPDAWDISTGTGVRVAVLDTGYRPHPDLIGNIIGGYDFISSSTSANDGNGRDADATDTGDWRASNTCSGLGARNSTWHGTHVAGTIAASTNNATGVAGIAFNARVVPVRVLGRCNGNNSDIVDAITWASGGSVSGVPANPNPARVINMSLGGPGSCTTSMQNAINAARTRGTVVVVSAGNDNANASGYQPAGCLNVITVAATDSGGSKASFSNFGGFVAISAPGVSVESTHNSGTTSAGADSYQWMNGTSMAAPHVSGAAALIIARNPSLTVDQVRTVLTTTTQPLPGTCTGGCGAGILNAALAAQGAIDTLAPWAPFGLTGFLSGTNSVSMSWQPTADRSYSGMAGYKVYRNQLLIATIANPNTFSYVDNTAASNTAYSYTVRGYDVAGNISPDSNALNVQTPPAGQPTITVGSMTVQTFGWQSSSAYYYLDYAGDIHVADSAWDSTADIDAGDWVSPKTGMSGYQARFTSNSGCSGNFDQWVQMSSPGGFLMAYVTAPEPNWNVQCTFVVQISPVGNPGNILGSATITLQANSGL